VTEQIPFSIFVDIEPRFRDTDAMGHVNNAVYISYLEVGRQQYWKQFGPKQPYNRVPFVMAHLDVSFRSPAHVGEVLRVSLRTSWVSRSSFGMDYEIRVLGDDRLVLEAQTTQVTYDWKTDGSMPVPEELRTGLERIEGRSLPGRPSSS